MSTQDDFLVVHAAKLSSSQFAQLASLVYKTTGIHMTTAKTVLLESRLNKRLRALKLPNFKSYINYLMSDEGMEKELVHMIDVVTTNKTDFFREPMHFEFLEKQLLPQLSQQITRPLRVWSAACSTGEEPYTLAMVLQDYAREKPGFDYTIIASDISTEVLQKAHLAIYDHDRVVGIPLPVRKRYLLKKTEGSRTTVKIVPELRKKIQFQRANLMGNLQEVEGGFDIVFCRNVLIYFDRQTQQQVLTRVLQKMRPKGYLFIGHSESLYPLDLPVIQLKPTVYQKR